MSALSALSVGVIGLGVGEKLAEGFANDPRCRLTTICDTDPGKLADVATRFPQARATRDPESVLSANDVDIVAIASYDQHHFAQAGCAIASGKHVFVEKPFVTSEDEAAAIHKALADNPRVRLSSNLILRKSPRFADLKARIASGELGELFYLEGDYNYGRLEKIVTGWRGATPGYSAVHGGGVHIVDLLMWLADDDIVEVAAVGNRIAAKGTTFDNFDMVVATCKFRRGAIGKMAVNFGCVFPHFHNLAVYGTRATFVNGFDAATLYVSRDPKATPKQLRTEYPGAHKGALIASFVDAIAGTGTADVTEADVFRSMAVCFAIEQSAHDGRPVTVKH